ncbi:MAG TPA: toll/interleukin-1 receptor domain-containing protein [Polyangiaceae bacterium]|nr:toll/interleukin-1 receptor domain-containing protein [Polyangiaceae bacterium]
MPGRLFVSYSSRDQLIADSIYDHLRSQGMRPWLASRDIPAGQAYAHQIVAALAESELLLLVLTPQVNASAQVPLELNVAKTRRLPILPVRFQAFELSTTLQYFLGASQWLDAVAQPWEQHLPQISAKARELLDGTDASAFSSLQGVLESLPPADTGPMRDAIRFGRNHALVTRLRSSGGDSSEREGQLRSFEQESVRVAQRIGLDEAAEEALNAMPQGVRDAAAGTDDIASIVSAAREEAELNALRILVRHGLRISSAFTLSFRLLMIGLYLKGLPPSEQEKVLDELTRLAEAAGLPQAPLERFATALQDAKSVDDSALEAIDELQTTLEDYALYRRAIALQRANLWEFGRKVALLALAYAEGASEQVLRRTRDQVRVLASALKFEVPPMAPRDPDAATARARAVHYVMHDIGKSVGPEVDDLYGKRFSSLLECSLKSSLLFLLYSQDEPHDHTTEILIAAVERSARAAALPSETWRRIPELVRAGARYDELKSELFSMQDRVARYLHGLAANATT